MKDSIKREKKEFTHSSERENFRPEGKTIMQDPLPTKHIHNLIIVDESGSMSVIRKQAFTGMNATTAAWPRMPPCP